MKDTERPKKVQRRNREMGASLIEVTLAMLISGIGLLSIAQLFAVAASLNVSNRNTNFMARAGQEAIEELRSKTFAAMTTGTTTSKYKGLYTVSTQVQEFSGGLKKITVTVEDTTATKGSARRSVFVDYRTDTQSALGSLYNSLAKASAVGGEDSGSTNPGSTPTPTPTPSATPSVTPSATPSVTPSATPTPTSTPTPTPTPSPSATPTPRTCSSGQNPSTTGCICASPMTLRHNGKCR